MATDDFNISPRGSNAANRLTPEQKLRNVRRVWLLTVCLNEKLAEAREDVELARKDWSHHSLARFKRRVATVKNIEGMLSRANALILALTAPAGGAE